VFTPLMAWVSLKLFGLSLVGLHLWPALAAWGTVILAGLTAREFGGSRRAQVLAAFTVVAVTLGPDSSSRSSNLSYLHQYFRNVRQAATLSNPGASRTSTTKVRCGSAPGCAIPGPSYGPNCATTTDRALG
jgi:hypothetical protein